MKIIIYIIFLLFLSSKINTLEEKNIFEVNKNLRFCGADSLKHEILFKSRPKNVKNSTTRKLSTGYIPMRIFLESTYFETQGKDFPYLKDTIPILKEALEIAIKGFTGLIEVEEETENLYSDITSEFFINNGIHKWSPIFDNGSDIKSDFLILAKIDNTNELPRGVLASAVPIMQDSVNGRPLAGLLVISNDSNMFNYGRIKEYFSQVFLHELTHALGFLYTMFPYFPGGFTKTVAQYTIRGVPRNVIITPKVLEVARKYYNCPSIIGVELEDQGGNGSANSHWEQRILLGDYMGAVIYQEEMTISEITLALLEDSAWYKINYYTGGLMRFGKNGGCEFIENLCLNNYQTDFKNEFFDYEDRFTPSCSAGRQSRTYSFLNLYQMPDNTYYYNFIPYDNYNYHSGAIYTADYCPTHGQNNTESFGSYFTGNCKIGNGNYGSNIYYINQKTGQYEANHRNGILPLELGEKYSNTSFCIMSSLAPIGTNKMYSSMFHPMCYQMHCSSSFLTVQINDDYIVCPRQGGNVQLKGYDGLLHCPDYNLICTGTVLCNDMFDCIDKKSLVKYETFEYDYTSLTTQKFSNLGNIKNFTVYELSNDGICPIYCSQCSKNKKCKKCSQGYNLVGSNEDDNNPVLCDKTTNVEKGYYKNEDDIYYLCSNECETCKEKKDKCIICKENYYFLENTNKCFDRVNYPKGYYFNEEKKLFMTCHENCETCSAGPISEDKMNCDSCKAGYNYDKNDKNCNLESGSLTAFIWILVIIIIALIIAIVVIVIIIYRKKTQYNENPLSLEMTTKTINY